ncbi:hypothetical protein [Methylobacterium marchantiae]|uniref:Uncharacterized protein n=1 Tax=Methylobacterium marchantiae TaxID=600331 RepID=A0ABW3WZU3_9HYPH
MATHLAGRAGPLSWKEREHVAPCISDGGCLVTREAALDLQHAGQDDRPILRIRIELSLLYSQGKDNIRVRLDANHEVGTGMRLTNKLRGTAVRLSGCPAVRLSGCPAVLLCLILPTVASAADPTAEAQAAASR